MALSHSGIPKNALLRAGWSHTKSAQKRIKDASNANLIQIPNWYFPHSGYTGALWIELVPKKLDQINTGGRGGTFRTSELGPTYRFLAPVDGVQETHNHDWSTNDSFYSNLLKIDMHLRTGIKYGKQITKQVGGLAKRSLEKGRLPSINEAIGATAVDKKPHKIDTPLVYENSARRQFLFTFPLLSEGLKTPLVEIVKDIQGFAAAKSKGATYGIEWPHVWSLQSEPRGVLNVSLAACTSVQVNWLDPYNGGIPQRCELTLGFTDVSPLFSGTIITGSVIEVTSKVEDIKHESYQEQLKNKGTLQGQIKDVTRVVREKLGYPQSETPTNP